MFWIWKWHQILPVCCFKLSWAQDAEGCLEGSLCAQVAECKGWVLLHHGARVGAEAELK